MKEDHTFYFSPSLSSSVDTHTPHDAPTVDKVLLLGGDDADQVGVQVSAALLCVQPHLSIGEVQVAVSLKLSPAVLTLLFICSRNTKQSAVVQRIAFWMHVHLIQSFGPQVSQPQLQMGWETEAQHLLVLLSVCC